MIDISMYIIKSVMGSVIILLFATQLITPKHSINSISGFLFRYALLFIHKI